MYRYMKLRQLLEDDVIHHLDKRKVTVHHEWHQFSTAVGKPTPVWAARIKFNKLDGPQWWIIDQSAFAFAGFIDAH